VGEEKTKTPPLSFWLGGGGGLLFVFLSFLFVILV